MYPPIDGIIRGKTDCAPKNVTIKPLRELDALPLAFDVFSELRVEELGVEFVCR
jgi:hypothetical protein